MKERTITIACGALCALVFASALFTPGRARGEAFDEYEGVAAHPVQILDPTPTLTASPVPTASPYPGWTEEEVEMLAKTVWAEARGVKSKAQQAAVVWCVLNRVDAGGYGETIAEVVSAPYQFAYDPESPVTGEFLILAENVLLRWGAEKAGEEDVGRTLPADYLFFEGDGVENHFRKEYEKTGETWDWSLPDPYEGG